jgi:hypothetical protein
MWGAEAAQCIATDHKTEIGDGAEIRRSRQRHWGRVDEDVGRHLLRRKWLRLSGGASGCGAQQQRRPNNPSPESPAAHAAPPRRALDEGRVGCYLAISTGAVSKV